MGQIIHLSGARCTAHLDAEGGSRHPGPPKVDLRTIISGFQATRSQITILLELATRANKIIDGVSDPAMQKLLRQRSIKSHLELIDALARVSVTISTLTGALAADALPLTSGATVDLEDQGAD